MPRKRPTIATMPGDARGIARVAGDFLRSCATQSPGLTEGQRDLMSRMARELRAEARAARKRREES